MTARMVAPPVVTEGSLLVSLTQLLKHGVYSKCRIELTPRRERDFAKPGSSEISDLRNR